ncbi:LuxR C-terminal-related transcriptional regulator [Chloroflexota bacterium]
MGEVDRAIDCGERVLKTLHPESNSMRGQTAAVLSLAYQARGDIDLALKTIQDTMDNYSVANHIIQTKMLISLCGINWLEGNIPGMKQPAHELLRLGEECNLSESSSFGRYFLGCYHYIHNELAQSESQFKVVVENRYLARQHYYAQCAFGLASCYVAQGNNNQARQEVETVIEYTFETNNTWLREIANVFCTELDLRLNQGIEAFNWTKVADQSFFTPMYVFYMPKLTAVRAMLACNTTESLKTATSLLEHLHHITVSTHNIRIQIDVLALQALLHEVQGEQTAAFEKLSESLALAEPGGFIRNYVDLGPKMADLLTQLQSQVIAEQSQTSAYISRVLAAFPEADRAAPPGEPTSIGSANLPNQTGLSEPLTKRELQTLKYLATDLSPQEIATEIYVSTATVRTHTKNIYSKLNVHSRLQAVRRAKDLGL